jgi:hypothetical protein
MTQHTPWVFSKEPEYHRFDPENLSFLGMLYDRSTCKIVGQREFSISELYRDYPVIDGYVINAVRFTQAAGGLAMYAAYWRQHNLSHRQFAEITAKDLFWEYNGILAEMAAAAIFIRGKGNFKKWVDSLTVTPTDAHNGSNFGCDLLGVWTGLDKPIEVKIPKGSLLMVKHRINVPYELDIPDSYYINVSEINGVYSLNGWMDLDLIRSRGQRSPGEKRHKFVGVSKLRLHSMKVFPLPPQLGPLQIYGNERVYDPEGQSGVESGVNP